MRVCDGLDGGAAPGGACWVAQDGEVVCHAHHGLARVEPSPRPLAGDMLFDLASVTKAIATTTCVLALAESGRLDLDAPAAEHLPELAAHGKATVTPRQLLTHQAGLPAWERYYETCATRAAVRERVLSTPLLRLPGVEVEYSDVGFLTLGFLVEAVTGERQDQTLGRLLAPLGVGDVLRYLPSEPARCVATERCPLRGRVVQGEVHDENAWRCDGVAGHAGLFGTVEAVGRFGQAVLDRRVLLRATWDEVFALRRDVAAERFWLGWKRLDYGSGDAAAFGHDGFTGTLLWVSPARRLVVALLTNRVHPTRENRRLYDLRPAWIEAAVDLTDRPG